MPRLTWFIAPVQCTLLEPMELIKDLSQGQVLEILTDCDGALEDIPAWCAKHGQVAGIQQNVTEKRLPGHASFCFEGIEGEALIFMLSSQGIYGNTGSACASKALKTSQVLGAIGIPPEVAQGSLVFKLNRTNLEEEVNHVLERLPGQ